MSGMIQWPRAQYWDKPWNPTVGCESGPKRRPYKIEWVESIVDQCRSANVPVFVNLLEKIGVKEDRGEA